MAGEAAPPEGAPTAPIDESGEPAGREEETALGRAFGAANRARLLDEYFNQAGPVTPENAWTHVYRLLLWIDRTIGLAHCYESDKAQPGRPWYYRTRNFHGWLARHLGCRPMEVAERIDWLFRRAAKELAVAREREVRIIEADPEGREFPRPGEEPDLLLLLREVFGELLVREPSDEDWLRIVLRIQAYVGEENKRNNLTGEGFEDTLAALMRRLPGADRWTIRTRVLLQDVPGFNPQGEVEKEARVDLALWRPGERKLVTAKWSVRADREGQFRTDFGVYVRANTGPPFGHILVTNEFDGARLKHACERVEGNALLFTDVVHVNPEAVLATYGATARGAAKALPGFVDRGRLSSLAQWLQGLFG